MKKVISLLFAYFIAINAFAQIDVVKLTSENLDGDNYLLSYIPSYCQSSLGSSNIYLQASSDNVAPNRNYSLLLDYSVGWEGNLLQNSSWDVEDVSSYTHLILNVYAPSALDESNIPYIVLVHGSSIYWDGSAKPLSNFMNPIPEGEWIDIVIPIEDLGSSNLSTNSGVNICCGWPEGGLAPGKLYINKVQFTTLKDTGINKETKKIEAPFYNNGKIFMNGYKGVISILDTKGTIVYSDKNAEVDFTINLNQGLYLLKTDKEVFKILIK